MSTEHLIFKSGMNISGFVAGMNKMEKVAIGGAASIVGAFGSVSAKIGALGAALGVGLSATAFANATRGVFNLADSLGALAAKTGIAVGDLLPLESLMADSGIGAEQFGAAVNRMQKQVASGGEAFKGLGVSLEQLKGMRPGEQFTQIGKAIAGIEDPAKRAAKAMQIFGKSGGNLLELFNGLKSVQSNPALTMQAMELEKNAELFGSIADRLDRAYVPLRGFFVGFATGIAPKLIEVLDRWEGTDMVAKGKAFADEFKRAADYTASIISGLGKAWSFYRGPVQDAFNKAADAVLFGGTENREKMKAANDAANAGAGGKSYKSPLGPDFWRTPDTRDPKNFWRTPDPRAPGSGFMGGKRGMDAQVEDLQRRYGSALEDDEFRRRFQPRTSSEALQRWASRMGVKDKAYNQIRSRTRAEREAEKAAKGETVSIDDATISKLGQAIAQENQVLINQ